MALNDPAGVEDLRTSLVLANRILVGQGVLDAFGHVSTRTGPGADTFWLSRNLAPGSVTRDDLLVHRLDGSVADDRKPYLERFIHAEIYRSRPDVMAVVHSHSPSVIPFGITSEAMRPVFHMAAFLGADPVPVYEISTHAGTSSDLLVSSSDLGASVAAALGDRSVALMRGHGSVATGSDLPEAVFRAVYTEINARIQLNAVGLGATRYLSPGEAHTAAASVRGQARRAWEVWCADISGP